MLNPSRPHGTNLTTNSDEFAMNAGLSGLTGLNGHDSCGFVSPMLIDLPHRTRRGAVTLNSS